MSRMVRESVAIYGAPVRPMSVREYYLAAKRGVFKADERLELIHGEVVQLSPQQGPHAWATANLRDALRAVFPDAFIRDHSPLRLDEFSEPEPDIVVARGPSTLYAKRHPTADEALLVVEVSDSSVRKDRKLKAALYASFGIPEYWLLNLKAGQLEVFREPRPEGYAATEIIDRKGLVRALTGTGTPIPIRQLLPE